MKALEHRIPPPFLALGFAGLGFALDAVAPALRLNLPYRLLLAALFVLGGFAVAFSATRAFKRADTTIDPTRPDRASTLVTEGVFGWTRNPMYVGLTLVLTGVLLTVANPLSLLAVVGLIAYLNRFQIQPEERLLKEKLGAPYEAYLHQVRRWL